MSFLPLRLHPTTPFLRYLKRIVGYARSMIIIGVLYVYTEIFSSTGLFSEGSVPTSVSISWPFDELIGVLYLHENTNKAHFF